MTQDNFKKVDTTDDDIIKKQLIDLQDSDSSEGFVWCDNQHIIKKSSIERISVYASKNKEGKQFVHVEIYLQFGEPVKWNFRVNMYPHGKTDIESAIKFQIEQICNVFGIKKVPSPRIIEFKKT